MTAYLFAGHLFNLLAPAAMIALLLVMFSRLAARFFSPKQGSPLSPWTQFAINFIAGSLVLIAGLALLGRDGKVLTYVVLVLATAGSQWWQLGGWKR